MIAQNVCNKKSDERVFWRLTLILFLGDAAVMLNVFVLLFSTFGRWFRRNHALGLLCVATLLSACSMTDGPVPMPPLNVPQERVHAVCWQPPNINNGDAKTAGEYFVMVDENGPPVSSNQQPAFNWAVADGALIYKYDINAPVQNLRLLPLKYSEAWCTRVPKPTDEAVLRLLDPCTTAALTPDGRSVAKNMMAQTESVNIPSPFFCGQRPRMAPTSQEVILMRARNEAFQESYDQQHAFARIVTQAKADLEGVTTKDASWLKQMLTTNPGSIEQIQQRVANDLNTIEAPTEYNDPILDMLALAGAEAGFDNGKFEVEATLFAIDVGVFLVEMALMEVALGPLGGAKLLTSVVSKGSKALRAAMVRLGDIPIFIPGAVGGVGGYMRVSSVLKNLSRFHARKLEAAMFAEARLLGKPLEKLLTDETHHIVAHGSNRKFAIKCRDILDKFGIDVDNAANGVFLPKYKSSPNPKGSIVHKILGNNDAYYAKMHEYLGKATSPTDVLQRLRRIGEALEKGTFFHAPL